MSLYNCSYVNSMFIFTWLLLLLLILCFASWAIDFADLVSHDLAAIAGTSFWVKTSSVLTAIAGNSHSISRVWSNVCFAVLLLCYRITYLVRAKLFTLQLTGKQPTETQKRWSRTGATKQPHKRTFKTIKQSTNRIIRTFGMCVCLVACNVCFLVWLECL